MQIAIKPDRTVVAIGTAFDALSGTSTEFVDDAAYTRIQEAQKLPNIGVTLSLDHLTATPIPPPTPVDWSTLRNQVVAQAQSAVGVTLANLTQAQRLALIACLLYSNGAIDPVSMQVKPLDQWLQTP